ncbi:MAG: methyltransferase [Caulobacteraceae bacterium]|nr:methyltransferase [Caulobacteraceae bacterium]
MMTTKSALVRLGFSVLAFAALASAPVAAAPAKPTKDVALAGAVSRATRPAQDVARDGARHPLESLIFWGVKPGQTVVEILPGTGYWTEILAPYAKATGGRYIVGLADISNPTVSEAARKGRADFLAKYADAKLYGTVEPTNYGATSGPFAPAGTVDLFLTTRNIHNLIWSPGRLDKTFNDAFAALKPGGILAIEEHRADPRPMVPEARDGYVSEAYVIEAAKKAGFVLDGRSDVNANPKDTKDHPFGVWTLPPTRRSAPAGQPANPSFDAAKYEAIGESDRMALRFRKPR